MTRGGNRLDQGRVSLGDPSQDEECPACVVSLEQVEELEHGRDHTALERAPVGPRHMWLKRRDLEVLLHVNGEVVLDHAVCSRALASIVTGWVRPAVTRTNSPMHRSILE